MHNTMYKLVSAILAERLTVLSARMLGSHQKAYILERFTLGIIKNATKNIPGLNILADLMVFLFGSSMKFIKIVVIIQKVSGWSPSPPSGRVKICHLY